MEQSETTWSVAELGTAIKRSLNSAFPSSVWLRGEIHGCKPPNRNGHQYFDLVEPGSAPGDTPKAKIGITLFKGRRPYIEQTISRSGSDLRLSDGIEIRIRGELDWWTAGGKLSFTMSEIDPVFTLGALDAQRRALIAKLQAGGLLDRNARLSFPDLPLRIGLVTSAGSAAHADFMNEISSSPYAFDVQLADARVQGAEAPTSLVAAIATLVERQVSVIVVIRGGGSRTDLLAFDHEDVATAIATAPVPVLTGIGHEIDRSVADEVAFASFKTPTAVAVDLITRVANAEGLLNERFGALTRLAQQRIIHAERNQAERLTRVARAAHVADTRAGTHLTNMCNRLVLSAQRQIRFAQLATSRDAGRVTKYVPKQLVQARQHLDHAQAQVQAYDPARVLARGWSLTHNARGELIRSTTQVAPGEALTTTLADGTVTATITETTKESK